MRFLLIEILILASVAGGGTMIFKSIMRKRENKALEKHEAYFSGGPLAQQTRKIPALNKSIVVEGEHIYQHQGGGVYIYKGHVDDEDVLSYELNP